MNVFGSGVGTGLISILLFSTFALAGSVPVASAQMPTSFSVSCRLSIATVIPSHGAAAPRLVCMGNGQVTAGGPYNPQGVLTWSSDQAGKFVPPKCLLHKGHCKVVYIPAAAQTGIITANYAGNTQFDASSGSVTFSVAPVHSRTTVSCSSPVIFFNSTRTVKCTAAVRGWNPTGTVTWVQSGRGSVLFSSGTCDLSGGKCSVVITANTAGKLSIFGFYGGDSSNVASHGMKKAKVGPPS